MSMALWAWLFQMMPDGEPTSFTYALMAAVAGLFGTLMWFWRTQSARYDKIIDRDMEAIRAALQALNESVKTVQVSVVKNGDTASDIRAATSTRLDKIESLLSRLFERGGPSA